MPGIPVTYAGHTSNLCRAYQEPMPSVPETVQGRHCPRPLRRHHTPRSCHCRHPGSPPEAHHGSRSTGLAGLSHQCTPGIPSVHQKNPTHNVLKLLNTSMYF